jgi:hypothetical protein
VLHQDVLDVGGVDVVAAPDDDVLAAADDVEVAVVVQLAQVARDQPAVLPHLRRGLGVAEVLALAPGSCIRTSPTSLAGSGWSSASTMRTSAGGAICPTEPGA